MSEKAQQAKNDFNAIASRIKAIDARLPEITSFQKHIGTYSKTLDVYRQYRDGGWNKKFYADHEPAITAHKAAKKFFDEQKLAKLPTINMLKQEHAALDAERGKLYQNLKPEREEMIALLTAKQNVDMMFGAPRQTEKSRENAGQDL